MSTLMTPIGVLSYPKLFVAVAPKGEPNGKKAYSTTILFEAAALETPEWKALVVAVMAAGKEKFGDKFEALVKDDKLKMPFRKDIASSNYPDNFVRFINLRNNEDPNRPKPQIIDRAKNTITDPKSVYPGVRARCTVSVFAFDSNGNRGVSIGLRNVQIVGDGPRLDSHKAASDEFGAIEAEAGGDAADDLASMLG